jgi:hypothetical protein
MTDEKSLAYKLGTAYGTLKKHRENNRKERIERMERELPMREKEMALKEREAKLKARQSKMRGGSNPLSGVMGGLEKAFSSPSSSHGKGKNSSFEPLIPDPLSDHPYHKSKRR